MMRRDVERKRTWLTPARPSLVILVILVILALSMASWAPLGLPGLVDPASAAGGDLIVIDTHRVSGIETYDRIRVTSTGTLEVPNGASLVSTTLTLEGFSRLVMTGGTVLLRGGPGGTSPGLAGSCQQFDMSRGSTIRVWGDNGTAGVDSSMGASTTLDVDATERIIISDSIVEVLGGHGLSPEAPLSSDGLTGDHCSGGDATFHLATSDHRSKVSIESSIVRVMAGDGGDAPDGLARAGAWGTRGGGYSDGGQVGGHVGQGGSATVSITGTDLVLDRSTLTAMAGRGGDAGDGADGRDNLWTGGGGGGYSGGAGASSQVGTAMAGGKVSGDVGSGGDVTLTVTGDDFLQASSGLVLLAGDGGAAGKGGDALWTGSGGGGGYSGAGGGNAYWPPGASGGWVRDRVGSGGDVKATLLMTNDTRIVRSIIEMQAGDGGPAGDGGRSLDVAGGGGGGYSGGGGAGSLSGPGNTGKSMYGGPGGPVQDQVASGGDATLRVNSSTGYMEWNEVTVVAGDGGRGGKAGRSWQDADSDMWMGGGGGGSYSAGGGGGFSPDGIYPRGGGLGALVTGQVGDGRDSSLRLEIVTPTIHAENNISASRGEGGLCWRLTAPGMTGGEGTGRFTRDGRAHAYIPRCRTQLLGPPDTFESSDLPLFSWTPIYPSTTNGRVMEYSIELAYDPTFDTPIHSSTIENATINFTSLKKGTLYWRVTPLYVRPERRMGMPSEAWVYVHLNSAPVVEPIPQVNITVRVPRSVDLYRYIWDVDDGVEDLGISYDSGRILWRAGLIVTFLYDSYMPPHDIHFNVTDGFETTHGYIPVRIIDDNHDPILLGVGDINPPVIIVLDEGANKSYKVRYYDRDGDPVTLRLDTAWDGITLDDNETLHIRTDQGDVGTYEPVLEVLDDRGGRSQLLLKIRVGNVGDPPETPVFILPMNGTRYNEGDVVLFTIGIKDPDLIFGDTVELTVISNVSGVFQVVDASGDVTFTYADLGPGHHRITAILKDGDYTVRADMDLVVVGDPEPANVWIPPSELWLMLALLVVSFVLLAVSYTVGYRRRMARRASK